MKQICAAINVIIAKNAGYILYAIDESSTEYVAINAIIFKQFVIIIDDAVK
jgi:hypothetical protein